MRSHAFHLALSITLLQAASGCVLDDEDNVATSEQAIINGTDLPKLPFTFSTNIASVSGCSAFALDSQWVLTATHCDPKAYAVHSYAFPDDPNSVKEIRERADFPDADITLVRVNPFESTAIKTYQMWNADLSSLVGQTVSCSGRGGSTYVGNGFETWRWARLQVAGADANLYWMYPNAAGQIQTHGDSGGACLLGDKVTGILTLCAFDDEHQQVTWCANNGFSPAMTSRIENVRQRSRMIFYNANNGIQLMPAMERNGTFTQGPSLGGLSWYWDIVQVLRNGAVVYYSRASDVLIIARVNKDGSFEQARVLTGFTGDWTHATAVGRDQVFLYNSLNGTWVVAHVGAYGSWVEGPRMSNFSTGWTHIVGTANGGLFFYNRNTITGAAGKIDTYGGFAQTGVFYGTSDWTHITAFGERNLLFYNQITGLTYNAQMTDGGVFQGIGVLAGAGPGYSTVVGATNGYFYLMTPSGTGRVARPNAIGGIVLGSLLTGLPTSYTHISAE